MQEDDLKQKIDSYLKDFSTKKFLHTTPHHDDTMLAYFPIVHHLIINTQSSHHFATMTSGFNSVSTEYLINNLENLEEIIKENTGFSFDIKKHFEVKMFLDGIAKNDKKVQDLAQATRMVRDIWQAYNAGENQDNCARQDNFTRDDIIKYINQVKLDITSGLLTSSSNDKVRELKGMIRDWEEEVAWGHLGIDKSNISHMKLGFYSSKDENFDLEQDIEKVVELFEIINPDIITVASEQEPIGHKTHIKVFKIICQAINLYLQKNPNKKLTIWEYRNVWCQFEPSDVNLFFPVTINDFYLLRNVFHNSYKSQIKALFPVSNHDGPFCAVMQEIMHAQYQKIKSLLGDSYFDNHENNRIKSAHGLCFINSLDAKQFLIKNNLG
jgi:glucosamine-6-phosphate deaminase